MTLEELVVVLESTTLPFAYLSFDEESCPEMPFMVYQEVGSNNFGADGKVYLPVKRVQIDLFTEEKQPVYESYLEDALNEAGIFWNKEQANDDDEHYQRYTYTIEI